MWLVSVSAENDWQVFVPEGCALGFCTPKRNTEAAYKVSGYSDPDADLGLRWDHPALGIAWPVDAGEAVVSAKDRLHPTLAQWLEAGAR